MKKLLYVVKNPGIIIIFLARKGLFRNLSDERYAGILYKARFGKKLSLDNPSSFNEKLMWLKLNDNSDLKKDLTDKLLVRDFVSSKIGSDYLIPLLGTWSNFEEIDFNSLPEKFVLKCNHDSQSAKVIEKKLLTKSRIKRLSKFYKKKLSYDYYIKTRELNYKGIKSYLIAEEFIESTESGDLKDYKFFTFNGEAKYIQVDSDRFSNHTRAIFTPDWIKTDYRIKLAITEEDEKKPKLLFEMIKLVEILAKDFKHVRVDLYFTGARIYFGEMTFHHGGAQEKLYPESFDTEMGNYITISE